MPTSTPSVDGERALAAAFAVRELDRAAEDYDRFRAAYTDPRRIPRSAAGPAIRIVSTEDWTSGFVAGSFWCLFEHTRDESWRATAERFTRALEPQCRRTRDHDIGFIVNCTFGRAQRLLGGDANRAALLLAAESLASRFSSHVGAIRSWDFGPWRYPVIIDNLMNLELLFRAAELGQTPRFAELALSHARTTLANHFRPDSSSYHVVDYDPETGEVIEKQTHQGLSDESAWARGQAWALYGCTMLYRETLEVDFLRQAQRIAAFYTEHPNMPSDGVPYFDFDAPQLAPAVELRDASAGAIAASALLELAEHAPAPESARYREFALRSLRSLASAEYRAAPGSHGHFLLMHSVGNQPGNDEVDVAINYADYYFLEALLRCKSRAR